MEREQEALSVAALAARVECVPCQPDSISWSEVAPGHFQRRVQLRRLEIIKTRKKNVARKLN